MDPHLSTVEFKIIIILLDHVNFFGHYIFFYFNFFFEERLRHGNTVIHWSLSWINPNDELNEV